MHCTPVHVPWRPTVVPVVALLLALAPGWGCASQQDAPPVALGAAAGPLDLGGALNVNVFYNDLAPYGEWFSETPYGWVWRPVGMAPGWRPYTLGHWVYSDDHGWTWVSDLDWGWACFHYGRWWLDDDLGWVWVPGRVWAPAWCAWRFGDGWIGWAPLPPSVAWRPRAGLAFPDDWDHLIGRRGWIFVHDRDFLQPRLHESLEPAVRNAGLFDRTRNVTRLDFEHGRIVNRSVARDRIAGIVGHPVRGFALHDVHDLPELYRRRTGGRELWMYRPRFSGEEAPHEPPFYRPGHEETRAELDHRHEAERHAMNGWLDHQERELQNRQSRERLEGGTRERPELQRRHEMETREMGEMRHQQLHRMQHRHERENQGRIRRGH
jgi:hypothetical protein